MSKFKVIKNYDCRIGNMGYRVTSDGTFFHFQENKIQNLTWKTLFRVDRQTYEELAEKYRFDDQYVSNTVAIRNAIGWLESNI